MRHHQKLAPLAKFFQACLRHVPHVAILVLLVSIASQYFHHGISSTSVLALPRLTRIGRHDPLKCRGLLAEGSWQPRGHSGHPEDVFKAWHPSSCTAHTYRADDVKACLGGRRLVFAGDSTIRQLFWAALRRLDQEMYEREARTFALLQDRAVDLSFLVHHVQLDFVWDPWLNSTALFGQLSQFRLHPGTAGHEKTAKEEGRDSPSVVVLGTPGLSAARNAGTRYLETFSEGINTVIHYLHGNIDDSIHVPSSKAQAAYDELSNLVVLAPVQFPAYDRLSFSRGEQITPAKISAMNWNLETSASLDQSHIMWSYNLMTEGPNDAYDEDGFHVLDRVADWRLNIMLNARCNTGLARSSPWRNEITCCVPYSVPTRGQTLFLLLALLGLPWLALDSDQKAFEASGARRSISALIAVAYMLAIAGYCYLADRTHLFDKIAKQFDTSSVAWSSLLLAVLAMASVRSSRAGFLAPTHHKPVSFLGRDQTEELKGLMQGFLLLYDFHGASEIPAMHLPFRLSVSAYIFFSCYGHARYFLRTEDFSFTRAAHVLCRLNVLSCLLSFMSDTQWATQYFSALASFWFLVTYATLASFRHLNRNLTLLMVKVLTAGVMTSVIIKTPGVVGGILLVLNKCFGVVWDVQKVHLHVSLDRFIPMAGVLVAAVVHRFTVLQQQQQDGGKSILGDTGSPFDKLNYALDRELVGMIYPGKDAISVISIWITFSGLYLVALGILGFTARSDSDNRAYDAYHPYASPWGVLAILAVRNCHRRLRQRQMAGAIALGRISLETSILKNHIWLAGDGTSILRIGSAGRHGTRASSLARPAELTVLTIVFLWAAIRCRHSTQKITQWLGPKAGDQGSLTKVRRASQDTSGRLNEAAAGQSRQDVDAEEAGVRSEDTAIPESDLKWKVAGIMGVLWLGNMAYGDH
ncbi:hypothetical protein D7B24_001899 [Verticillium nonalfalfae]|uniref:Cas1p 10 TM acyl transferase domain-containing protein n=1 Tax=Verticillium nonalfalfae TaxID=1051616 RepID=A0A3M9XYY7_9PEZI|nr:uncharacterized protein D7B24_001899 [Verticillium nonalfalfae]RNJ53463.1 hypothetical protein D7B24_001899 [Verticillium nonalfalfae]